MPTIRLWRRLLNSIPRIGEFGKCRFASCFEGVFARRRLSFTGHDWAVKSSEGAQGEPGGTLYSNAGDAVWVDGDGAPHLMIRRHQEIWHCSEGVAVTPWGLGRHRIRVQSELSSDQNVVAAIVVCFEDQHEMDIGVARFGSAHDPTNARSAVQPPDRHSDGFPHRFGVRPEWRPTIHEVDWRPDVVDFRCLTGAGDIVAHASTSGPVPPGPSRPCIDRWLYAGSGERGLPPSDGSDAKLVVGSLTVASDSCR